LLSFAVQIRVFSRARYNLDIELGGTAADAVLYGKFVAEFSDALHPV
jgi:hypothetical protein